MKQLLLRGIRLDQEAIPFDSYVRKIPSLQLDHLDFHQSVTFLTGENGSGKSTLLEAIAVAAGFNPEGGSRNYHFSSYDSHSPLHNAVRLIRGTNRIRTGYFLRAESFYNVATAEEREYADSEHPSQEFHKRSHGESFLRLAEVYLNGGGLYFFDEPEAALAPQRQMTLMLQIHACAKQGAQFIIATHSPILLSMPDAEILSFDDGHIHPCTYEETGSYQVTSMFINNRERILNELFSQEDNEQ